jgi:hypothetical protein
MQVGTYISSQQNAALEHDGVGADLAHLECTKERRSNHIVGVTSPYRRFGKLVAFHEA